MSQPYRYNLCVPSEAALQGWLGLCPEGGGSAVSEASGEFHHSHTFSSIPLTENQQETPTGKSTRFAKGLWYFRH